MTEVESWWRDYPTSELEQIRDRKKREFDEILQTWTNHDFVTMRTEQLAEDITRIDMELRGRK